MMNITELRNQIDEINRQIVDLYKKRMEVSGKIAAYKKENNLPVFDSERERKLLCSVSEQAGEEFEAGIRVLFTMLMELSRSYQNKLYTPPSELSKRMNDAIENTPKLFPERAVVACQGVEGAYSQDACEKLFSLPAIMYFNNFENIFQAIDKGMCRYGILPLENSTAGSVNRIYDLMISKKFNIVRSVRVHINHLLLAKKGANLSDITEIISHEQAISQCSNFLSSLKNVKVTVCENTAIAAQTVAKSDRGDIAAIASPACSELYNLAAIEKNIQNTDSNYTRFICISKNLEIYPGADRTSLMMVIPHKPGSLYRILSRFYALGINLTKLESRPIPGKDFEFMFYFDLNASIYSPALAQLICELENEIEDFSYLGSYSEII